MPCLAVVVYFRALRILAKQKRCSKIKVVESGFAILLVIHSLWCSRSQLSMRVARDWVSIREGPAKGGRKHGPTKIGKKKTDQGIKSSINFHPRGAALSPDLEVSWQKSSGKGQLESRFGSSFQLRLRAVISSVPRRAAQANKCGVRRRVGSSGPKKTAKNPEESF